MWKELFYTTWGNKLFEKKADPLAPMPTFIRRLAIMACFAFVLTSSVLSVGVLGYHYLGHLPWLDAFLNASMILSGMGEVSQLSNKSAKIFAGTYALCSGLFFTVIIGLLFAPVIHRLYHKFHLDEN